MYTLLSNRTNNVKIKSLNLDTLKSLKFIDSLLEPYFKTTFSISNEDKDQFQHEKC